MSGVAKSKKELAGLELAVAYTAAEFMDEAMKAHEAIVREFSHRCSYCGTLRRKDEIKCSSCGGPF